MLHTCAMLAAAGGISLIIVGLTQVGDKKAGNIIGIIGATIILWLVYAINS